MSVVALVRGLLLDLLATGDRSGADAAAEPFISSWSAPDETAAPGPEVSPG